MKMLLIHSDYIEFEAKKPTAVAEEVSDEKMKGRMDEVLVVFITVEEEDEENPENVAQNGAAEIVDVATKVNAENIFLYPYAHLSSSLGSPETTIEILDRMLNLLVDEGFNADRSPFGYYKAFKLSCKGHPLAELSRTITSEPIKKKRVEEPPEMLILTADGETHSVQEFDFSNFPDLEAFTKYEAGEGEGVGEEPPHVKLMREKELADYEASSDVGHLRWYPAGKLVRDLLADYVQNLVLSRGAMPVETPIMYDLGVDAIRKHAEAFGERQYRFKPNTRRLLLRFAACFGMFTILHDTYLTEKNLPLKLYELATYSFRYERRGEVIGLKRLRSFVMPDMHTLTKDIGQAQEELEKQFKASLATATDLKLDYVCAFRMTKQFFSENRSWINQMAEHYGKPILLEVLPRKKHYWVAKIDLATIDNLGRPVEGATVQIDVESSERFDIKYHLDGGERYPIVLHYSPTGSIERIICSLLEKAGKDIDKGRLPMFPVWLSPVQVRIIPVADRHLEYAEKVAMQLEKHSVRVDVDDRPETVPRKVRDAGKDWVPYVVVVGDREVKNKSITVTVREKSTLKKEKRIEIQASDLIKRLTEASADKPFRPLPLPKKLSNRITFVG